jgi:hypothetical protein
LVHSPFLKSLSAVLPSLVKVGSRSLAICRATDALISLTEINHNRRAFAGELFAEERGPGFRLIRLLCRQRQIGQGLGIDAVLNLILFAHTVFSPSVENVIFTVSASLALNCSGASWQQKLSSGIRLFWALRLGWLRPGLSRAALPPIS